MKNIILFIGMLILGLFNITAFAQGSWSLQTNPTTSVGESIQFVSFTEGWINLTSNQLLHTTDSGAIWNIVTPNVTDITIGTNAPGSRISFINPTTGWVLKSLTNANQDELGVVLYKTTNSGSSWNRIILSNISGDKGFQVQFVDANNGWVSIYNNFTSVYTFLKTTDGGINWTTTNGNGVFYYVNATIGHSFSFSPNMMPPYTFYKTINGGQTWTTQHVDNTLGSLNEIQFTYNTGWIVGDKGKIFKTDYGGATWNSITINGITSNYTNSTVSFISSITGYIATKSNIIGSRNLTLKTIDGGIHWTSQFFPIDFNIKKMHFMTVRDGWAIDVSGKIAMYSEGIYDNASLNGPWLMYTNVTPINPNNNNLNYLVFDGNGNIIDMNSFGGPWTGHYTVSASGVISATLTNGIQSFPIGGQLTSTIEGTAFGNGQNWRLHKVANPGALKDKITGTLTTNNCGSRNVTINIDNNGIITSATGLTGPVTGRVYADLGVYIGHMNTGEMGEWHELSIMGHYSNNNLVGQLALETNSCTNQLSNLVRSDNLGINDNIIGGKNIIIYPNPNNGLFCFDIKEPALRLQIEIYNHLGQKVYEATNTDQKITNEIYFEPQTKGVYFIKIYDGVNVYKDKLLIK